MTIEECQALLADARKAYHSLMTGVSARVIVDQNGQRVEFTAANRMNLMAYINQLDRTCPVDVSGAIPYPVGPAGFVF